MERYKWEYRSSKRGGWAYSFRSMEYSKLVMNLLIQAKNIASIIDTELSDLSFQKKVWVLGEAPGDKCYSFEEAICGLYDDCFFEDFIKKLGAKEGQGSKIVDSLNQLNKSLSSFLDSHPNAGKDVSSILQSQDWLEVVDYSKKAALFLNEFIQEYDIKINKGRD